MAITIPTHNRAEHQAWWRALQGRSALARFDPAAALRALGRHDLAADDVFAYVMPSRTAALLSARANREAWGHPTIGIAPIDGSRWVVVLDIRPWLGDANSRGGACSCMRCRGERGESITRP